MRGGACDLAECGPVAHHGRAVRRRREGARQGCPLRREATLQRGLRQRPQRGPGHRHQRAVRRHRRRALNDRGHRLVQKVLVVVLAEAVDLALLLALPLPLLVVVVAVLAVEAIQAPALRVEAAAVARAAEVVGAADGRQLCERRRALLRVVADRAQRLRCRAEQLQPWWRRPVLAAARGPGARGNCRRSSLLVRLVQRRLVAVLSRHVRLLLVLGISIFEQIQHAARPRRLLPVVVSGHIVSPEEEP
mmetsp:Transcript_23958/g.71291  ORF Transcript_23958/g.71291 Transcript_23958/m.71291 type:complete len:248 (-) Transcript_23958:133-876(-)